MPPRKANNIAVKAQKRKNADRSEDEQDPDFDYTHKRMPQNQKQRSSKSRTIVTRPNRQHAVPSLSSSDSPSPTAPTRTFTEERENWRTELSELKRAKRFTEEDRGFIFTRKKTTIKDSSASIKTTTASKPGRSNNPFIYEGNSNYSASNPPLSPEGTPTKDRLYDRRGYSNTTPLARLHQQHHQQNQVIPQTPERNRESIVTIPLRETPMINRNKDMRNDARRSSFNMRGKRASSIGNGFHAQPHPSVDPKNFFRHIATDISPPIRMKQLMAWCARKSIDSQSSNSQSALKVAKQIEEEALASLLDSKFSVSWYNRPKDAEPIATAPKKPHQQNVDNLLKLKECEAQIAKLQKEDDEWTKIISSFNSFHASILDNGPNLPNGDEPIILPDSFTAEIELDFLTADEKSLWEKHCNDSNSASTSSTSSRNHGSIIDSEKKLSKDNKWMIEMMGSLEKEVDNLRDTLYAASRFDKIAKQYTDQVLEQIAGALDERQRPTEGLSLFAIPEPSSVSTSGKGAQSSISSSSLSSSSKFLSSAPSLITPGVDPDSVDDPRQILRALSRLSL
ncbi:hypothetical protein BGZ76_002899 [Entomortierella beljakovae]|nr:hypothetical protein BGZ76_002899 [Entomortierella beljakovae]